MIILKQNFTRSRYCLAHGCYICKREIKHPQENCRNLKKQFTLFLQRENVCTHAKKKGIAMLNRHIYTLLYKLHCTEYDFLRRYFRIGSRVALVLSVRLCSILLYCQTVQCVLYYCLGCLLVVQPKNLAV